VPVVPFGAGTNVEGQVIPVEGGISLDLTRLDRMG
jgi:D-lactate dehydrogenase (cytochrome)